MPEGKFEAVIVAMTHKKFKDMQLQSKIVYSIKL
jgi:hypothetical protein